MSITIPLPKIPHTEDHVRALDAGFARVRESLLNDEISIQDVGMILQGEVCIQLNMGQKQDGQRIRKLLETENLPGWREQAGGVNSPIVQHCPDCLLDPCECGGPEAA